MRLKKVFCTTKGRREGKAATVFEKVAEVDDSLILGVMVALHKNIYKICFLLHTKN
jgi:hypothetical protein